jgi:hypothetical protein
VPPAGGWHHFPSVLRVYTKATDYEVLARIVVEIHEEEPQDPPEPNAIRVSFYRSPHEQATPFATGIYLEDKDDAYFLGSAINGNTRTPVPDTKLHVYDEGHTYIFEGFVSF